MHYNHSARSKGFKFLKPFCPWHSSINYMVLFELYIYRCTQVWPVGKGGQYFYGTHRVGHLPSERYVSWIARPCSRANLHVQRSHSTHKVSVCEESSWSIVNSGAECPGLCQSQFSYRCGHSSNTRWYWGLCDPVIGYVGGPVQLTSAIYIQMLRE